MKDIESQLINGNVVDAILQLDSLLNVLDVYLESKSDIEEMIHACVIVDKMHEQVDMLKMFIESY